MALSEIFNIFFCPSQLFPHKRSTHFKSCLYGKNTFNLESMAHQHLCENQAGDSGKLTLMDQPESKDKKGHFCHTAAPALKPLQHFLLLAAFLFSPRLQLFSVNEELA